MRTSSDQVPGTPSLRVKVSTMNEGSLAFKGDEEDLEQFMDGQLQDVKTTTVRSLSGSLCGSETQRDS